MLSIVTPMYDPNIEHLAELAESISNLSAERELEWSVCYDAAIPFEEADELLRSIDVNVIRSTVYRNFGCPEIARNVALQQTSGKWVMGMDQDDVLEPSPVTELLDILESGEYLWGVGRSDDYIDGEIKKVPLGVEGPVSGGQVYDLWKQRNHVFPFHTVGLIYDRNELIWSGGWNATETGGDILTALLFTETRKGFVSAERTIRWRTHAASLSQDNRYIDSQRRTWKFMDQVITERRNHEKRLTSTSNGSKMPA